MKKVLIAILVLSLLLMPSAVIAASGIQVVDRSGDGEWADNTWQVEMFPSEVKSTTITLRNSSSSSLSVNVSVSPDSLDGGNLVFELDKSSFTMPGGGYTDVILTVRASGSATPGTYTTELEIKSEVPPSPPIGVGAISKLKLYNLRVDNITEDSADILWETSRTSTSEVTYWSSPETTVKDESYSKEHLVHLDNLQDDTTYYFKVVCEDRYGLKRSDKGEFTTLEVVPVPEPIPPEPVPPEPVPPEPVPPEPVPVEPEPVPEPTPTPEKPPWGLIGGILGGLAVLAGGATYWMRRRKREQR